MRILDRYIGGVVVVGTVIALLVLTSLELFFAFVGEIGDLGKGGYGLPQIVEFLLLTLPRRMYDLFPMAALLGSLMSMGALASSSELIVMRAAGVSILRIARAMMQAGVVMAAVMMFMGEVIAPPAEEYAQNQRALVQSQQVVLRSVYGFWARDGADVINVRQILPNAQLSGIYIYSFDDQHRLKSVTRAQTGQFENDTWTLVDVSRSLVGPGGVETERLAQTEWRSLLNPEVINVVVVKPANMSISDLSRYVEYQRDNGLDARPYELAYWTRLLAPVAGLVMLFLAIPFVFGPLRAVGAGQRVVVGVLIGVGFYLLNQTLGHLGQVYGINPLFSAAAPMTLFFALGLAALARVR